MLSNLESGNDVKASMPVSVAALSPRAQRLHVAVKQFINEYIIPTEHEFLLWSNDPKTKWKIYPRLEQLKSKAKSEGLWNLFLTSDYDPDVRYGAGLSNVEFAFIAEEMGKSFIASEVFNSMAPDAGNIEVLVRYGSDEQKQRWLMPLLDGTIRSCFAMTEPAVASSDAANIQASIRKEGDSYVINGHKWWSSGAMDPRCKVCIFMGKTTTEGSAHRQQSMILVPMDSSGVTIVRSLTVFGYDDSPFGRAEIKFDNVRVPVSNLLLDEGRGFEIAQVFIGSARVHHCMRSIGVAERALNMMIERAQSRVAFGHRLIEQSSIQQDIAKSRIDIEKCRLLVLKAAHMIDVGGTKAAFPQVSMIKAAIPTACCNVLDRAIQVHGGLGVSQETRLAQYYALMRSLRIADGPDEVHLRTLARLEVMKHTAAKL